MASLAMEEVKNQGCQSTMQQEGVGIHLHNRPEGGCVTRVR